MASTSCYHCGDSCEQSEITFENKKFCCNGCKTVYEIFSSNGLESYYDIANAAGSTPKEVANRFDFLDNSEIAQKLLEFDEEGVQVIEFHITNMHCSSCIWVLENLNRLQSAIKSSLVDFPKKRLGLLTIAHSFHLRNWQYCSLKLDMSQRFP